MFALYVVKEDRDHVKKLKPCSGVYVVEVEKSTTPPPPLIHHTSPHAK